MLFHRGKISIEAANVAKVDIKGGRATGNCTRQPGDSSHPTNPGNGGHFGEIFCHKKFKKFKIEEDRNKLKEE